MHAAKTPIEPNLAPRALIQVPISRQDVQSETHEMPAKDGNTAMPVARPNSKLVSQTRQTMGLSREELGQLIGLSKRTVGRIELGQSAIVAPDLCTLARHVHPRDAGLAEELARAGRSTLSDLGVVPPAQPVPMAHLLIDSVVCAAADAMNVAPESVRGSVLAAFRRARELHMSLEDVENALTKQPKG
jgi:DNA-binding XRE family transcriptional regulator